LTNKEIAIVVSQQRDLNDFHRQFS
jgi:hypothetical protein